MKRMTLLLVLILCLLAGCAPTYTTEELNDIKQEAYDEGYADGTDDGYQDGYDEGYTQGHGDGYDEGYKDGYADGMKHPQDIPPEVTYVANKSSMKFHRVDCDSVNDIDPKNRMDWEGDRQGLIDKGYEPCKRCNP